ncbi:hypothetical protein [Gulbenkiania indica]|uniref:hypothetical protein n=1 Tax=Gulbenkiania indica TaxID=375574 RepID=UPI0014707F4E|nr:hypothetical protein [Gulbenkiania indica]
MANRRQTLEPQEESHCTHEYFTQAYVAAFPAPQDAQDADRGTAAAGERRPLYRHAGRPDAGAQHARPLTPGATRPGTLSYREVRRFTQQGGRSC